MSDEPAAGIRWKIEPNDIEWEMDWGEKPNSRGVSGKETQFEPEGALALLLANGVVFLNENWWEKDWPEDARKTISVNVNCNDVFAWGCSDAESLPYEEIEPLYRMWRKDPSWGAEVWCMQRRKQMPQAPVEKRIRDAGIWDLNSMGLSENAYDAAWRVNFAKAKARSADT